MANGLPTISLNEALKRRIYDIGEFTSLRGINFAVGEASVDFVNDIVKYLTFKDDNAGILFSESTGELIQGVFLYNNDSLSMGDPRTRTSIAFNTSKGLFSIPLAQHDGVVASDNHDFIGPQTVVNINGTNVYQVQYEIDSLGLTGNVFDVFWWFENPNNIFRVEIINNDTGATTFISHDDEQLLNGQGVEVPGSGEQAWSAVIPSIFEIGPSYTVTAQSLSPDFLLRGDSSTATWTPYAKFNVYAAEPQLISYFPAWTPGDWNEGDWVFMPYDTNSDPTAGPIRYRNKIYVCNTTGAQTGDWETNKPLYWDILGVPTAQTKTFSRIIKESEIIPTTYFDNLATWEYQADQYKLNAVRCTIFKVTNTLDVTAHIRVVNFDSPNNVYFEADDLIIDSTAPLTFDIPATDTTFPSTPFRISIQGSATAGTIVRSNAIILDEEVR